MNDDARTIQATSWDSKRAASWQRWFPVIERGAQVLSDRMVALAQIGPGDRVLDVATGLGEPAVTAARAVGPEGHVDGVDLSSDMLDFARARVADLKLGNIDFLTVDVNELAAPAHPYDAVLSRWGLMFMPDLPACLRNLYAMIRPGGSFVAGVWGHPDGAPALSLSARTVLSHLGMPPPAEDAGTPFALNDVAKFAGTVEATGFIDVTVEEVVIAFSFSSCDEFARLRRERSAPLEARIAHFPKARRDAAWRAVSEAAQSYADSDGVVHMQNTAYCVSAKRP